ncbi:hypothetical protein ACWGI8_23660 [Streptomyces sp. NPDC054841]
MADYFDRLLARYTPVAAAGGAGGPARVRPRLPGPFERVEALRTAPPEPGEPAALIPSAPAPAFGPAEPVRHEREVRTDRLTVVRTETARPGEPERPTAPTPAGPSLRPAAHAAPGPRPVSSDSGPASRRPASPAVADTPRQTPASAPRAADPAPVAAAATPARPRSADTAAARGPALNGVGRRAPRPAERVVHVQIGRLEVSATPPPGANRPAAGHPDHTGRRAPALALDDYLARGEKRD